MLSLTFFLARNAAKSLASISSSLSVSNFFWPPLSASSTFLPSFTRVTESLPKRFCQFLPSFSSALSAALSPSLSAADCALAWLFGAVCSSSLNLFEFSLCLVTPFVERSISPPVDDFSSETFSACAFLSSFTFDFASDNISLILIFCPSLSVSLLSKWCPYSLNFISYSK